MKTLLLIGLTVFGSIALITALFRIRQPVTARSFFLMDGKLRLASFVGTMTASNLSLGNLVLLSAIWGYLFGWSGLFWLVVCIALLYLGYELFKHRFEPYITDSTNDGSLHEYIAKLFSPGSSLTQDAKHLRYGASFVTVLCLLLALVLELHICAVLISPILGTNLFTTFAGLAVAIGIYTALGGFRSVVWTDIAQAILVLAAIVAIIYFVNSQPFGSIKTEASLGSLVTGVGWANAIGISFVGFGWLLVTMDTWQRNCASRNGTTTRVGIAIASLLMISAIAAFAYVGIYVHDVVEPIIKQTAAKDSLSQGFAPFNDLFLLEPLVDDAGKVALAVILLGLVMAALSTADTFLIVVSHSLTTDIVLARAYSAGIGTLKEREQHLFGQIGRIAVVLMTVVACLVWLGLGSLDLLRDPLTMFFVFYAVSFSLLTAILVGNFARAPNAMACLYAIIISSASGLAVGLWLMQVQLADANKQVFGLLASQWIALLPIVIFVLSIAIYSLASRLLPGSMERTK